MTNGAASFVAFIYANHPSELAGNPRVSGFGSGNGRGTSTPVQRGVTVFRTDG